jgi:hypothetical protein
LNGIWQNNYVKCGLTADGGVRVQSTKDMAMGKENWDVLVEFASEGCGGKRKGWKDWVSLREMESHVAGVGQYGLFAKGTFKREDVASVKWMAEEGEIGISVAGESAELSNYVTYLVSPTNKCGCVGRMKHTASFGLIKP